MSALPLGFGSKAEIKRVGYLDVVTLTTSVLGIVTGWPVDCCSLPWKLAEQGLQSDLMEHRLFTVHVGKPVLASCPSRGGEVVLGSQG